MFWLFSKFFFVYFVYMVVDGEGIIAVLLIFISKRAVGLVFIHLCKLNMAPDIYEASPTMIHMIAVIVINNFLLNHKIQ